MRAPLMKVGAALVAGLLALLAGAPLSPAQAPEAAAAEAGNPSANPPLVLPAAPAGFAVDAREAYRIAREDPNVAAVAAERGPLDTRLQDKPPEKWQVGFFDGEREVVQVHIDSQTGKVRESWTGDQVAWQMARGYEEQFGHALNSPWVWIPLAAIFFFGLLDWRRPFRVVHLDLLVLLSFGISHIAFNDGEIGLSVPLAYPPLLWLLGRMLWIGFRGGGDAAGRAGRDYASVGRGDTRTRKADPVGLRPSAPRLALLIACLGLIAFRVTLNVVDSGVIDVGYAGVVGADRVTSGEPIYGEDAFPDGVQSGDTYGPANYYAYVPFEAVWPWSGEWDSLPAAHAAAVYFDLAAVLGLFVLGVRMGGRAPPAGGREASPSASASRRRHSALAGRDWKPGAVLAFAWLAYPYTAFALQANSNDSLVAVFLIWGLVALTSPVGRGALVALAAMVKFAPLALVPLYLVGERGLAGQLDGWRARCVSLRPMLIAAGAAVAMTALMLAHPAIDPGLATFYERTVESQLDRESPFSIWGQTGLPGALQTGVLVIAALIALAAAVLPRRRDVSQIAALAAAILIATQLAVDHWFYLYIPWFSGLVSVALLARKTVP